MRNLKKILALALALVMTMSVMSVANAFDDDADINETYKDAVDVLAGLKVFEGYEDGNFLPQGEITRAEVAAIIYRIATGDVDDTQVGIYADYNIFTDVPSTAWYAGYVNYCANAQYINGYGDGKFGPQDKVTGYQALAMILRAVGYGKNGEFTGADWSVNTAARANQLGVSNNVTAGLLGLPATRETVAELLFRSILVDTVNYTMLEGYKETGVSLGEKTFGLEEVEGVVVANEFANLYGTSVLADGKTNLELADGTIRNLLISSTLEDMGESRYAYITTDKTGSTVLALGDTGNNNVWDPEGVGTALSKSTIKRNTETEYYVNFGRGGYYTSDWRIEYTVTFNTAAAENSFDDYYIDISDLAAVAANDIAVTTTAGTTYPITYEKVIRAETKISDDDLEVIRGIFGYADDSDVSRHIDGSVYVGTKSASSREDASDEMSYRTFFAEYINDEAWEIDFDGSDNGEWLKVIDNDNDGYAEYAFLTEYWLDEVVHTRKSGDNVINEYNNIDMDDLTIVENDELEIGDVVLYTNIDGKAVVQLAEMDTDVVNYVSFKDEIIRTDGGDEYGQSEIYNETGMDQVIINMDEKVEYNLYFDRYGYVRAYELTAGTQYGLLTELYGDRYQNSQYVTSSDLWVELKAGAEAIDEFEVLNASNNDFLLDITMNGSVDAWSNLGAPYDTVAYASRIILQPATAHLGLTAEDLGEYFTPAMTNVAKYVMTDDGVRIEAVAEYMYDENGDQLFYVDLGNDGDYDRATLAKWKADASYNAADPLIPVYAVDYIELDPDQALTADDRVYDILDTAGNHNNVVVNTLLNDYVNAVHDTEYYIVERNGGIQYFTDYVNLPAIAASNIEAMYAVARNTAADNAGTDYWVADVVVIEVNEWNDDHDSVSLAFYNTNQESSRDTKRLDTLNDETEDPEVTVVPQYNWGRAWRDYGFYKLYDTELDDSGELVADSIVKIDPAANPGEHYEDYRIYAGVLTRVNAVSDRGGYLMIDTDGDNIADDNDVDATDAIFYSITETRSGRNPVYAADTLHLPYGNARGDVKVGDRVIWVEDSRGDAIYVVDVSIDDTPAWLTSLYTEIWTDQNRTIPGAGLTTTSTTPDGTAIDLSGATESNGDWTIPASAVQVADYTETITAAPTANFGSVVKEDATGNWIITNVTGPVTVTVTYVGDPYALTYKSTDNSVKDLSAVDAAGTAIASGADVGAGTKVTVTFTVVTANNNPVVSVGSAAKITAADVALAETTTADTWTATFTMPAEALTLDITAAANYTVTAPTGITLSKNTVAIGNTLADLNGLRLTPAAGKQITAVNSITMGGVALPARAWSYSPATGMLTVTASDTVTGNIVIDATVVDLTWDVTVDLGGVATAEVDSGSTSTTSPYVVKDGENLVLTLTLAAGADAAKGLYDVTNGAPLTANADGTYTLTVSNVSADTTVKIANGDPKSNTGGDYRYSESYEAVGVTDITVTESAAGYNATVTVDRATLEAFLDSVNAAGGTNSVITDLSGEGSHTYNSLVTAGQNVAVTDCLLIGVQIKVPTNSAGTPAAGVDVDGENDDASIVDGALHFYIRIAEKQAGKWVAIPAGVENTRTWSVQFYEDASTHNTEIGSATTVDLEAIIN